MANPTTSAGFSSSTPAPDNGYQNAKPRDTGTTPLDIFSFEVPNTGGAAVKTANYTAVAADCGTLLVFNSGSAVTLTLPASIPFAQWQIAVQNIGAGTLTINPNGKNLDNAGSITISQNAGVSIYTDGSNYFTERGAGSSTLSGAGLIQLIQSAGQVSGTGTNAVSFISNVQKGSTIIVAISVAGTTSPTISDSQGNTYTAYNSLAWATVTDTHAQYVALNVPGGALTVTVSGGTASTVAIFEFSNVDSVDASSSAQGSGSSSTLATGTATATVPTDVAFLVGEDNSSTTSSITNSGSWPSILSLGSGVFNTFYSTIAASGSVSSTLTYTNVPPGGFGHTYAAILLLKPRAIPSNPMTTKGDIIIGGTSGIPQRLAAGTNAYVLTSNGPGNQPSWLPAGGGGGGTGLFSGILSTLPTRSGIGLTTAFNASGSFVQADTAMGVSIYDTNASTTAQWEGLVKAYPGSAYTLTALMAPTVLGADYYCYGVVIMNTTSGKFLHFGLRWHDDTSSGHGWEVTVMAWNSPSSFNSFPIGGTTAQLAPFYTWLQVVDNGTNITFNMSTDGVIWQQVYTVSKASSFLGSSGFNYIGIGIYNGRTSGTSSLNSGMTLVSWSGA